MKHIVTILISVLLLTGCGVGNYSVSSGIADQSSISFTYSDKIPVQVIVDGTTHNVYTVKEKAYKARNMRHTEENTIKLEPGTHDVRVMANGDEIYSRILFISASEHRIIDL